MSARAWALPGVAAALACSTVAAPRQDRYCVADDDCLSGQVCSNNTCYESELPSETAIALDIRDDGFFSAAFRVEILGTDHAVIKILDDPPNRYYVNLSQNGDDRPAMRDELELSLLEARTQLAPGEEAEAPLVASVELQQASRFGRTPLTITGLQYPELDPKTMEVPEDPTPLVQPWPRYDPPELHEDKPLFYTELPLYIEITPQDDVADADEPDPEQKLYSRGIIHRQLMPRKQKGAGVQPFVVSSVRECHRKITSRLRFPGGAPPNAGDDKISISGRHAGRDDDDDPATPICDQGKSQGQLATCSPATIVEQPNNMCETDNECAEPYRCYPDPVDGVDRCGCMLDADCPSGQICNVEHQLCALDLTDRTAIKSITVKNSNDAVVDAWVYTYCDEDPTRDHSLELVISVNPDTHLGLPSLRYRGFVDFLYSEFMAGVGAPMKFICLPTWDLPRKVALDLRGPPIAAAILGDSARTWSCCDTACLTGAVAVSSPQSCLVKEATIGASGEFTPPEPAKWDDSCMDLHGADEHGAVRVSYPGGTCPADDKPCTIDLSPGPVGGDGQDYRLRIEPPVGSIFRSTSYALKVGAGTSLEPISLDYRVLLRGQVLDGCSEGGQDDIECSAAAEIVAERIIRDEDPATLLGPFFYTTSTISGTEGEYVLPLNPGVYLLTALPKLNASGSQTGPAPIRVIDLREGSSELTLDPGTGVLLASAELVLAPGAVYNLELDNFALSSRVVPLDLSSWSGLRFENKEIDLNAPGTCSLSEGCQIRRLRPGNSPARLSQEQFLRYVARSVDAE